MVLQIGEVKWMLHFHTEDAPAAPNPLPEGFKPLLWDRLVRVHVHTGPCIETIGTPKHCVNGRVGVAKCSLKDQFVRSVGNRLALTNALKGLPADTRKAIWRAYWLKTRRPKESSLHFQARVAGTTTAQAGA